MPDQVSDIAIERHGAVSVIEIRRGPHNYFSHAMIAEIGDALEALDRDPQCRAVVLAAEGKSFCAGADLSRSSNADAATQKARALQPHIYKEGARLFQTAKPIVVAVQGAAIGGGVGLTLVGDFRVTCPEAYFWLNFTALGFHPGFGITATLPHLIGQGAAANMLYTSRKVGGAEAKEIGLADRLCAKDEVRSEAMKLAQEIAANAPLAVISVRRTLRRGLADAVEAATERELMEQNWLRETSDFEEGKKAITERRPGNFKGS